MLLTKAQNIIANNEGHKFEIENLIFELERTLSKREEVFPQIISDTYKEKIKELKYILAIGNWYY